jgi:hypothetical protein
MKEGLMNKRIVAISILMLMMCAMVVSVFADDQEYEYEVTVYYYASAADKKAGKLTPKKFTVYATSARQAETLAQQYCTQDFGEVASCGQPRATGRTK